MIQVNCDYNITNDIGFFMDAEHINNIEFARRTKVSRTTVSYTHLDVYKRQQNLP